MNGWQKAAVEELERRDAEPNATDELVLRDEVLT